MGVFALLLSATTLSGGLEDGKPWAPHPAPDRRVAERIRTATTPAELVAAVHAGLDLGLVATTLDAAIDKLPKQGGTGELGAALGLSFDGTRWRPVEAEQFAAIEPATQVQAPQLDDRTRSALLKRRFQEFKLVNKSTYFDLSSDLPAADIQPYTDDLNDFYRSLRNRFRANLAGNIDVVLFGDRSDYLLAYLRGFGKSGENVLGFYVPSVRRLVFYDDRYDRDAVALTARHECTHLLVDLSLSGANVAPWFDEGLACYLAANGPAAAGRYTAGLMRTLQREAAANRWIGIDELLNINHEKLKYVHYAFSWALVHFLNQGENATRFNAFVTALRTTLPGEADDEARGIAGTRRLFEDQFGAEHSFLDGEVRHYFLNDFRLERPDQYVAYGLDALTHAAANADVVRSIDDAADCFASVVTEDVGLGRELAYGRLAAMVARAENETPDLAAQRLLLRRLAEGLGAAEGRVDESQLVHLIRRALLVTRSVIRAKEDGCLREQLVKSLAATPEASQDQLRAIIVLHDVLLERAFGVLARALAGDPLHQPAAHAWLLLALDCAPRRVREVFDHLQLLVDNDPDDRNLAALGLAYVALGKKPWGQAMLKRATDGSPRPGELMPFRVRAGLK